MTNRLLKRSGRSAASLLALIDELEAVLQGLPGHVSLERSLSEICRRLDRVNSALEGAAGPRVRVRRTRPTVVQPLPLPLFV